MSELAKALPAFDTPRTRGHHGRPAKCDVYGMGDLDDWRAVTALAESTSWAEAEKAVNAYHGLEEPVGYFVFSHHWRRKCGHWTAAQRAETL